MTETQITSPWIIIKLKFPNYTFRASFFLKQMSVFDHPSTVTSRVQTLTFPSTAYNSRRWNSDLESPIVRFVVFIAPLQWLLHLWILILRTWTQACYRPWQPCNYPGRFQRSQPEMADTPFWYFGYGMARKVICCGQLFTSSILHLLIDLATLFIFSIVSNLQRYRGFGSISDDVEIENGRSSKCGELRPLLLFLSCFSLVF